MRRGSVTQTGKRVVNITVDPTVVFNFLIYRSDGRRKMLKTKEMYNHNHRLESRPKYNTDPQIQVCKRSSQLHL